MARKRERIQWKNQIINFLAIVLGVYVAFYLTNRKLESDKHALERQYIQSMLEDLKVDEQQLTESTDTLLYFRNLLGSLANHIYSGNIPSDSLSEMVQGLYVYLPFIPRNNTYQTLLASGSVDVIKNFSLRQQMVELYHQYYGAIEVVDRLNEQQRNLLINPYLIKTIQYGRGGKIVNAEALWVNSEFSNIISTCYYAINLKYECDKSALEKCRALRSKLEQL